jgi:hypothetical protein
MEIALREVRFSPTKDVYNPGDVLTVAIFFAKPWTGEVEVGLALDGAVSGSYPTSVFARSGGSLYEGQVHVRREHIGTCRMLATFTGVDGKSMTEPAVGTPFAVRPIVP